MNDAERDDLLIRLDENVKQLKEQVPTFQTRNGCGAVSAELRNEFNKAALTVLRARTWQVLVIVLTAAVMYFFGK
uniref:Uncharacterized protein n=1 Tax=viral metagenome TaxID=1070528 RepID=A0A6M3IUE6_9ZZZZ